MRWLYKYIKWHWYIGHTTRLWTDGETDVTVLHGVLSIRILSHSVRHENVSVRRGNLLSGPLHIHLVFRYRVSWPVRSTTYSFNLLFTVGKTRLIHSQKTHLRFHVTEKTCRTGYDAVMSDTIVPRASGKPWRARQNIFGLAIQYCIIILQWNCPICLSRLLTEHDISTYPTLSQRYTVSTSTTLFLKWKTQHTCRPRTGPYNPWWSRSILRRSRVFRPLWLSFTLHETPRSSGARGCS